MKRVTVETPGTCGEYIQGWFGGAPCLISSPIDRFSRIVIAEGVGNLDQLKPKTCKMVDAVFRYHDIPLEEKEKLHFMMTSDIPLEKGMASSTADLAGMAAGLSRYFGLSLSAQEIGKLCTGIEPSDNLMFEQLNLFNHIEGSVLKELGGTVEAELIIIDFHGGIDTMTFNETQDDYSPQDLAVFGEIVALFEQGVETGNLKAIGEACTRSAYLNQKRLKKPYLDQLDRLSREFGGLGMVVGHSGTVIGIMFETGNCEEIPLIAAIKKHIPETAYADIYRNRLIPGGIKITIDEV
jgi:L-threonine kinase